MREYLQNRDGLRIVTVVEGDPKSNRLVFVTHGLSGSKDQPHIIGIRETFVDKGFTVVSFDTAHSFGESGGDSVHATATSYISDLEDVIDWAEKQEWYKEPFIVAGHSLGGISSLIYASKHPDKVSAIFPMSTVVSGKLWYEHQDPEYLKDWQERGYYFKESQSMPGRSGKVGYGLAKDLLSYDALEFAPNIKCPVLLLVGSEDKGTTPEMHQMLFDKLGGSKELHVLKDMGHTPRNQQEIDETKRIIRNWISKL